MWDTASWECERTIAIGSHVYSILVSGNTVFSGCQSGDIVMSSWATGEREGTVKSHNGDGVNALAVCGGQLHSGGNDHIINMWL